MPIKVPNISNVATGLDSNAPVDERIAALSGLAGDWIVAGLYPDAVTVASGKIASFNNRVSGGAAFSAVDATDRAAYALDAADTGLAVANFAGATPTDRFVYALGGTQPDYSAAFSFVVWFKPVEGQDETVFGAYDSLSALCALWLFNSTKVARFRFSGSFVNASGTYVVGQWNYAVMTYDGAGTIKISLNGSEFSSTSGVVEAAISSAMVLGDGLRSAEQQHFTGMFRRLLRFTSDKSGDATAIQAFKDYGEWVLGITPAA